MMRKWWDLVLLEREWEAKREELKAELERFSAIEETAKAVWERYHIPALRSGGRPYWEALGEALGIEKHPAECTYCALCEEAVCECVCGECCGERQK